MKGYITIVSRRSDRAYQAEVLGVPGCACEAPTVEEALHAAGRQLTRHARLGRRLPGARPAADLVREVERHAAVAGACLRPRRAAVARAA